MRAVIIALLCGLVTLATLQPAAGDEIPPPPFSVGIDGVHLDGPVGDPRRMWYGVRSLDGEREHTYTASLPKKGGFVAFGGASRFPDGYCITWVTVQWKYRGFHSSPLCTTGAGPDLGTSTVEDDPEETTTTPTESPDNSTGTTAPPREDDTPTQDTATEESTADTAPEESAETTDPTTVDAEETTTAPEDGPSTEATTAAAPATELPVGTKLVSSGADLGEVYAQRSIDATQSAADTEGKPETPTMLIFAACIGLVAVSGGAGIVLSRLLKDPRASA